MADVKPCQKDLLHWLDVVSFALNDVQLFLDTHPCDPNALEFFDKYHTERKLALKEYSKHYGALTIDTANSSCDIWNWINNPWPWQKGGC